MAQVFEGVVVAGSRGEAGASLSRPCPAREEAWHGARLNRVCGFGEGWLHLGRVQTGLVLCLPCFLNPELTRSGTPH